MQTPGYNWLPLLHALLLPRATKIEVHDGSEVTVCADILHWKLEQSELLLARPSMVILLLSFD